ncbi:MAG: molybdopterin dinucleotide-binding protein [Candidatus Bathyarchaeota archaeon]|nr:molybdopterin dinucleotide-binding protein [Candidatus Bathyarchaeota archaeon]
MSKTLKVLLLTGRTVEQGREKERSKFSREYMESVAACYVDPDDMEGFEIRENSNIRITTSLGSVVVKARKSLRAPHAGSVFIPYGAWANLLIGSETDSVGMPSFKGVPAEIEPSPDDEVSSLEDLVKKHYRKA